MSLITENIDIVDGQSINVQTLTAIDTIKIASLNTSISQLGVAQLAEKNDLYNRVNFGNGVSFRSLKDYILSIKIVQPVTNFDYTGNVQETFFPQGTYQIECWGAQGGGTSPWIGAKGAYVKGTFVVPNYALLHLYVGQCAPTSAGGWNGGGAGGVGLTTNNGAIGGGGATDVRLLYGVWSDITSLRSRIIVAAGGAAGNNGTRPQSASIGHGGGLTGLSGSTVTGIPTAATGGTQTSGGSGAVIGGGLHVNSTSGVAGSFGQGGQGPLPGGGGGGYYGGGTGAYNATTGNITLGAGGSSFISGHPGCNAININGVHTGQPNHFSGTVFIDTQMIAGNVSMPNPRGAGNITGNGGHGYIRITKI